MTNLVDKYECSIFNVSRMRLNFLSATIENIKLCAHSDDDGGIGRSIIIIHCIGCLLWFLLLLLFYIVLTAVAVNSVSFVCPSLVSVCIHTIKH